MISARVNSKTYSCAIRKAAYQRLENQVPVESNSHVIIRELAQQQVDFLPDKLYLRVSSDFPI